VISILAAGLSAVPSGRTQLYSSALLVVHFMLCCSLTLVTLSPEVD
jgi:hypothetical protein